MKKNTSLAVLAIVAFDAIVNALNEAISASTKDNLPTT